MSWNKTGDPEISKFKEMIADSELSEKQKSYMLTRWLHRTERMVNRYEMCRVRYRSLRLGAVVGSVIVPVLASLNITGPQTVAAAGSFNTASAIRWAVLWTSLITGICSASESFMQYGDRWRHSQAVAERLKKLGWDYFNSSGQFNHPSDGKVDFQYFEAECDKILDDDMQGYFSILARQHPESAGDHKRVRR